MEVRVDVDKREFLEGFKAAFAEVRDQAGAATELTADKVVERMHALVPKRTQRLDESIGRGDLVHEGTEYSVEVHAGGPGVREAVPMEFGTYKDRAQPYFRPALAAAAGVLRGSGAAARLATSGKARKAARRARARAVVRSQRRRGMLSAAQARAVSRQVSNVVRERSRRR